MSPRLGITYALDESRKTILRANYSRYAGQLETSWESAHEKARVSRTIFAQRRLRPDDVLPEWHKAVAVLGGEEDVRRFVRAKKLV